MKRACSVDGCLRPYHANGYCSSHDHRFRRHGDPLKGKTAYGEPWRYLQNVILLMETDECINWPFARNSNGYGMVTARKHYQLVHRVICEQVNGPPPSPDHEAAHTCGKGHEACVNKRHLVWKTHAENMGDTLIHGTHVRGTRNGHAKLTDSDVMAIRRLRGVISERNLASNYGVSRGTINSLMRRRSWSWLV